MHQIPPAPSRLTMFTRTGTVRSYPSLAAAVRDLGWSWINENVGEHFRVFDGFDYRYTEHGYHREPIYRYAYAIFRDEQGEPVSAADIWAHRPRSAFYRYRSRLSLWNGTGPVPGTGRFSNGRYYRKIATLAERCQSQMIDPEEPAPRAARNMRNLPNSWDDLARQDRGDRSWKRYRRTQWAKG